MAANAATTRTTAKLSRTSRRWTVLSSRSQCCWTVASICFISSRFGALATSRCQVRLKSSSSIASPSADVRKPLLDPVDANPQGPLAGPEDLRHVAVADVVEPEQDDGTIGGRESRQRPSKLEHVVRLALGWRRGDPRRVITVG